MNSREKAFHEYQRFFMNYFLIIIMTKLFDSFLFFFHAWQTAQNNLIINSII